MVAPLVVAAIIGAVGSMAQAKMQAEQEKMKALGKGGPAAGGQFGLPGPTGTDKFTSTLTDLNEGKQRPPLFAPGHAPDDFLSPGKGYTEDQITGPKQLFADQATAEQAKSRGELGKQMAAAEQAPRPEALEGFDYDAKKKGFDVDKTMQYAAMAAQLGSMLAGPPAPPPPGRGGGGSFNYQPVTMRSVFGG